MMQNHRTAIGGLKRQLSNFTRVGGMTYQGHFAQFRGMEGSSWIKAAFRPPFSGKRPPYSFARPQVRGGRWKIRRIPVGPQNRPWYAWSDGKAGKCWSRRFETHAEAAAWAHRVANTYRQYPDAEANAILGNVLKYQYRDDQ